MLNLCFRSMISVSFYVVFIVSNICVDMNEIQVCLSTLCVYAECCEV